MLRTHTSHALAAACCLAISIPGAALADTASTAKNEVLSNGPLAAVLAAQPAETKKRYEARHPLETLTFFEVQKGDTVIETLPGGGWYSHILYSYLGDSGNLIGAHYPKSLFERFGWDKERVQRMVDRGANWPKTVAGKSDAKGSALDHYIMTEMPDRLNGSADKVLFIRSLHNINRFDTKTGHLDVVLKEAFRALKPGGIAGVVQHRAQETASDEWADGSNGYLKQSKLVVAFEAAGFKLVEARDINANPKDRPTEKEFVWRLPPSLRGAEENSPKWRAYKQIGESDRMTLKFIKPAK